MSFSESNSVHRNTTLSVIITGLCALCCNRNNNLFKPFDQPLPLIFPGPLQVKVTQFYD